MAPAYSGTYAFKPVILFGCSSPFTSYVSVSASRSKMQVMTSPGWYAGLLLPLEPFVYRQPGGTKPRERR